MNKTTSKWYILIAVLIPVLMGPIDASAVNIAFTRNVGMVIGIALGSAVLATRQAAYLLEDMPFSHLLATQDAYFMAAFLSIICFAACLFVKTGETR